MCEVLVANVNQFIYWRNEVFEESPFPNTAGCIDVCEMPISAPTEHPNSYYNRKKFHSIKLQAICNDEMKFLDVFTGLCGSMHDARAWNLSDISRHIANNVPAFFPNDSHILGDGAYPLSQFMMTPYRDAGRLTRMQSYFNLQHAKTRNVIERAFALLKGRWRRLNYLLMYDTARIPLIILAACILHNICLDDEDEEVDEEYFLPLLDHGLDDGIDDIVDDNNFEEAGQIKRNRIAEHLYINRVRRE